MGPDAVAVVELVDDPIGADSKRPQAAKPTPKQMARLWFALDEAKRLDHRIGHRPFEVGDLPASPSSELDSAHRRRRESKSSRSSSSVTVSPTSYTVAMQTSMRITVENRDALALIAATEMGGASLDEALRVVLFEHQSRAALAALAADPEGAGSYLVESAQLAEVDLAVEG